MPNTKSKVKAPIGMQGSWFHPIKEEPDNAHPIYEAAVDMGAAVKGYLSVTTATASIPGDDIMQVEIEKFVSGQLDVETTMSDLEVNSKLYGHEYNAETGELSKSADAAPNGGYSFIEPILQKDKTIIYRASCFFKTCAMSASEKQEADTKKSGELSAKNNAVSLKVLEDNTGAWRLRNDFESYTKAKAFIDSTFKATSA